MHWRNRFSCIKWFLSIFTIDVSVRVTTWTVCFGISKVEQKYCNPLLDFYPNVLKRQKKENKYITQVTLSTRKVVYKIFLKTKFVAVVTCFL